MRILIDIGHPAHVHYFKNFIWQMQKKGHEFMITARDRKHVFDLLRAYGSSYISRGKGSQNLLGKILYIPQADYSLYKVAKKFNPDLFLSFGSMYAAHVSKFIGKPHIAFDDTEHAKLEHLLYVPFTDIICTPTSFKKNLGKKQIRFNGYMELCYLHPKYFKPDPAVLVDEGLKEDDAFFILRFVSWDASHDFGQKGFSFNDQLELIRMLEKHGRVIITSEKTLPPELEKYKMNIPPDKIHHLLSYATLYVGEGATMASEAAVLGTPSIYINTLRLGYLEEQERKYGLTIILSDASLAIEKATELLDKTGIKNEWMQKRQQMLSETVDVTAWMENLIIAHMQKILK